MAPPSTRFPTTVLMPPQKIKTVAALHASPRVRGRQGQEQRPQPGAVMQCGLKESWRRAGVRIGGEPPEAPEPALERIPGEQDKSDRARDEQREQGAILPD